MHGLGIMGMGAGMWIFWVLVLAVIIWSAVALGRRADRPDYGQPRIENPLDILKKRYASGELSTREYEERRKVILGG